MSKDAIFLIVYRVCRPRTEEALVVKDLEEWCRQAAVTAPYARVVVVVTGVRIRKQANAEEEKDDDEEDDEELTTKRIAAALACAFPVLCVLRWRDPTFVSSPRNVDPMLPQATKLRWHMQSLWTRDKYTSASCCRLSIIHVTELIY